MHKRVAIVSAMLLACLLLCVAGPLAAQQTTVGTPFHTGSNSYFEQFGVNFGVQTPNFFFHQNSFGLATPPFGGFTPGAGATAGFQVPFAGGTATFNIAASQGSRSSSVMQSPSATMMNGLPGGFFDASQTPFVMGVVPVVGEPPQVDPVAARLHQLQQEGARPARNPAAVRQHAAAEGVAAPPAESPPADAFAAKLAAARSSTAGQPTLSVAELRQLHAAQAAEAEHALEQEIAALVTRAGEAEQAGKPTVARLYYEQAARRASGAERAQLTAHAQRLSSTSAGKKRSAPAP